MSPDQDQLAFDAVARDSSATSHTEPGTIELLTESQEEDHSTGRDFVIVTMDNTSEPKVSEPTEPGHIHSLHPMVYIHSPPPMKPSLSLPLTITCRPES